MTTQGNLSRDASYSDMPLVQGKRAEVLQFVRDKGKDGTTRSEIADGLGWPINCVTGRVNELEEPLVDGVKRPDMGLIITTDRRRPSPSGKAVSVIVAREFINEYPVSEEGSERVNAVVQFVADGKQWVSPREIAAAIMTVRDRNFGKWPAGSESDYLFAIELAINQGKLLATQGRVWIKVDANPTKSVQLNLF